MSDKELVSTEITHYMNLLRIRKAENKEAELNNQLRESRVKLESFGITVDDLKLD